jgi:hypothetical protein
MTTYKEFCSLRDQRRAGEEAPQYTEEEAFQLAYRSTALNTEASTYTRSFMMAQQHPNSVSSQHREVKTLLTLTGYQLAAALDLAWPDRSTDHEQGETEMSFWIRSEAEIIEDDRYPAGIYAYWPDVPEEGSVPLDIQAAIYIDRRRSFAQLGDGLTENSPKLPPLTAAAIVPLQHDACRSSKAGADILAERRRQVESKGWDHAHDDAHPSGEIAAFAAVYAMPEAARNWDASSTGYGDTFAQALTPQDWAPKFGDRRRDLVKAGALILAEIERIDRTRARNKGNAE